MKVLVMQHKAGNRFRTVQYYQALQQQGVQVEEPDFDLRRDWKQWLEAASQADVVWIARLLLSPYRLYQLFKKNPRIVFDFDDAVFLRSSRHGARSSLSKKIRFKCMVKAARCVVAGNDFLKAAAERQGARKVIRIPTVVNQDWYAAPAPRQGPFTVGWSSLWVWCSSMLHS